MATLQNRGSKVVTSEKAVAKSSIASDRSFKYDLSDTHYHAKYIAKMLNNHSSTFKA